MSFQKVFKELAKKGGCFAVKLLWSRKPPLTPPKEGNKRILIYLKVEVLCV
jgi:hypothetical protein